MLPADKLEATLLHALDCLASSARELHALSKSPAPIPRAMLRHRARQLYDLANELQGLKNPPSIYDTRKSATVLLQLRDLALYLQTSGRAGSVKKVIRKSKKRVLVPREQSS